MMLVFQKPGPGFFHIGKNFAPEATIDKNNFQILQLVKFIPVRFGDAEHPVTRVLVTQPGDLSPEPFSRLVTLLTD